jgi:hypothetical protein
MGWHHARLKLPQETRINPLTKTIRGIAQKEQPSVWQGMGEKKKKKTQGSKKHTRATIQSTPGIAMAIRMELE